jgi:hypothetical protein
MNKLVSIVLFTVIVCVATKLINLSDEPWNKRDMQSYRNAHKRCRLLYPKSPCLKKFIKVRPLMYRAICGGEDQ